MHTHKSPCTIIQFTKPFTIAKIWCRKIIKKKVEFKTFFSPNFLLGKCSRKKKAAMISNKFYFIFIVQSVSAQKCNKNVFFLLFSLWNDFFLEFLNWITFLFPSIWSLTLLKAFQSTGYYISIEMYVGKKRVQLWDTRFIKCNDT